MHTTSPSKRGGTPDKAVLFCPDCGHHSRYDDEWHVVDAHTAVQYVCPVCGTEITSRPRLEEPPAWPVRSCRSLRRTWDANRKLLGSVWRRSVRLCVPG